jgi:hypothetical protein
VVGGAGSSPHGLGSQRVAAEEQSLQQVGQSSGGASQKTEGTSPLPLP